MRTEVKIPLQYFIIAAVYHVYSEPTIDNISILLFKKHIIFFEHDKLIKYTYWIQMLTMIQVIW